MTNCLGLAMTPLPSSMNAQSIRSAGADGLLSDRHEQDRRKPLKECLRPTVALSAQSAHLRPLQCR
jgi:hypothetical protein